MYSSGNGVKVGAVVLVGGINVAVMEFVVLIGIIGVKVDVISSSGVIVLVPVSSSVYVIGSSDCMLGVNSIC